jgi:8-oxo-dGTP pyrophosphatase MutT (NUDIX family)
MVEDRFRLRLGVHMLIAKDGKVLLLRRINARWGNGSYIIPAGHADGEEKASDAAIREAKEEVGVEIDPKDLEFIHAMHYLSASESLNLFFKPRKWKGEPKIMEPNKCDDMRWFPLDKLPENTLPYIIAALRNVKDKIPYSEFSDLDGKAI